MNLLEQINRIERLDQLIRMKATGTPAQLASRLKISKRTLYNILDFIKRQGAEVYYCRTQQSFCYQKDVYFHFGFTVEKVHLRRIKGGEKYFFGSAKFLHWGKVYL